MAKKTDMIMKHVGRGLTRRRVEADKKESSGYKKSKELTGRESILEKDKR